MPLRNSPSTVIGFTESDTYWDNQPWTPSEWLEINDPYVQDHEYDHPRQDPWDEWEYKLRA